MLLSQLQQRIAGAKRRGADVDIGDVVEDSRLAGPGKAFCAIRGMRVDGHEYIDKAIASKASAIISEHELDADVPQLVVPDSTRALGVTASALAGEPGRRLTLVGVTGTNGKTTCSYLIESVLEAAGGTPGVIGTVNYRYRGTVKDAPYTTPVPGILHRQLAEFADAGCDQAVLEVSSAALAHGRVEGMEFGVGVFTNISQDHLDLHGSMDAYVAAKARLFSDYIEDGGAAVIVLGDHADDMIAAAAGKRIVRVSVDPRSDAEVRVVSYQSTVEGIRATIETPRGPIEVESSALLGEYNVANLATAVAVGEALGLDQQAVKAGLAAMPGVPGRVERVPGDHGLDILVDYAHTPDALANVLAALRPITRKRLICVFGCGGDRDPSKRPKMGAEVARGADLAVVTSDNPRTEDPQSIIDMILPAVPDPAFVDVDRRTAIRAAIAEATPGDVVVIAGKGHEDYQILGETKIHFDDREEAAAAVDQRPVWTAEQVASEVGGRIRTGDPKTRFFRPTIDGRQAAPGDLYVAIVGERFDGHDFVGQAAQAGATGALVKAGWSGDVPAGLCVIEAGDPREALGRLAHHHRRRWNKTLVAITGSSGKTTVKDLSTAALSPLGRVHRPAGSLNNETGVPLTILALRPHHDVCVVEMGMRGLGQIDYLADIARPDVACVVNAGTAHIELLGSREAILTAKSEIYGHLPGNGTAIAPSDDPRLLATSSRSGARVYTFGFEESATVRVADFQSAPGASRITLSHGQRLASTEIPLAGRHSASNAACAVAIAMAAGADFEDAAAAVAGARMSAMRGQLETIAGRSVLIDCYNANPASMEAALKTANELAAGRKVVAVVGDMLELGDVAAEEHRKVGALAAELDMDVVALGEQAGEVVGGHGGRAEQAASPEAAATAALQMTEPGDWIVIKASRGMRLERVAEALRQEGQG